MGGNVILPPSTVVSDQYNVKNGSRGKGVFIYLKKLKNLLCGVQ